MPTHKSASRMRRHRRKQPLLPSAPLMRGRSKAGILSLPICACNCTDIKSTALAPNQKAARNWRWNRSLKNWRLSKPPRQRMIAKTHSLRPMPQNHRAHPVSESLTPRASNGFRRPSPPVRPAKTAAAASKSREQM